MTTNEHGQASDGTAVGYGRVSTEAQLDGLGLDVQRDAIAELADAEGLELVNIYIDEGISGSEGLDTRRALAAALDYLCDHPGTTLIVPRLDRLARDLMLQETVLADIWKAAGHVLSCSPTERLYCQPDDPTDPARTLIRQVLGAVAAYERAMIRLRLVRGRRMRIERTGWAGGPVPYGWECDEERATLAHIDAARRAGTSWRRLAVELNTLGRLKRNGQPWNATNLHRIHTRAQQRTRSGSAMTLHLETS